jgi:hypothetical protein
MGFNPVETELEVKTVEPVGNLADDVDIMTHASRLGTSFLGVVDFGDGDTVIDPENEIVNITICSVFRRGGNRHQARHGQARPFVFGSD